MSPNDPTGDDRDQPTQAYPQVGYPKADDPTQAYPAVPPVQGPPPAHPSYQPDQPDQPGQPGQPPAGDPGGMPGGAGEPLGSEYMMFETIGRGAMGQVRRARTRSGELVAVKQLRPELGSDAGLVTRFLQERSILVNLHHPNVVQVRDMVAEGQTLAIVMDLVNGSDLRSELTRVGTLPAADAVSVIISVLHGLSAVHAAGVVHRDLKPENVLLDTNPQTGNRIPKITDFGISSLAQTSRGSYRTGAIGTPEYMAPELIGDGAPSKASDIYAVGVVLYELLCGVTPFQAQSALALMNKHVQQQPGQPQGVPDPLWSLISALLAKDPGRRPDNALQVAGWLEGMLPQLTPIAALPPLTEPPLPGPDTETIITPGGRDTEAVSPPPSGGGRRTALIAAVGLLVVAIIAGVAYVLFKPDPDPTPIAQPTPSITTPAPITTTTPDVTPSTPPSPGPTAALTDVPDSAEPAPGVDESQVLPDYSGQSLAAVAGDLVSRGLGYTTEFQYDTSKQNNTVVDQTPGVGQPAGSRVALTVTRTAVPTELADIAALGSDQPQIGPLSISGKRYERSLSTSICDYNEPSTWQYDLGSGGNQTLSGVVGLADTSSSGESALVQIYADGNPVFNKKVSLQHPQNVKIDVTGILRLKIVITDSACTQDGVPSDFVFGNAVLLAPPSTIPTS